jgi:glycine betaine/proline transport system permease protein
MEPNTLINIPLSDWVDAFMDWVLLNLGGVFNAIGDGVLQILRFIEQALLNTPWFVVIIVIFLIAWWASRRWWFGLFMAVLFGLISTFGEGSTTPYWDMAMSTLAIVITSVFISLVLGIPTGILMARSNFVQSMLKPLLDGMQTMPSFVYLVPAVMLFGLGMVPAVFATVIYAIPPVIRLTNVGIRQVSSSVVEAARAFGANSWQMLTKIQVPLALPSIMVGINQTTLAALAMVVIASMIGARGLGQEVLFAINKQATGRAFEAGLSVVIIAIVIDRIMAAVASRQQKAYKV